MWSVRSGEDCRPGTVSVARRRKMDGGDREREEKAAWSGPASPGLGRRLRRTVPRRCEERAQ